MAIVDYDPYTPSFPSPYPDGPAVPTDVAFETPLWLMRREEALNIAEHREAQYILAADYTISYRLRGEDERRRMTVPSGMLTDLASVPAIARSVIGRVGPHLEAAIVHDWLFIAWQDLDGQATRGRFDFANDMMEAIMLVSGMSSIKIWAIASAVRVFGRGTFDEPEGAVRYVRVPRRRAGVDPTGDGSPAAPVA